MDVKNKTTNIQGVLPIKNGCLPNHESKNSWWFSFKHVYFIHMYIYMFKTFICIFLNVDAVPDNGSVSFSFDHPVY